MRRPVDVKCNFVKPGRSQQNIRCRPTGGASIADCHVTRPGDVVNDTARFLRRQHLPFIVDRRDGSVHVTGTAYPIEDYLQSYARIGRTYPFAVPEYVVVLSGWKPGMLKISLTKAIRKATGIDLPNAKRCTDDVLARKPVALTFSTPEKANEFQGEAEKLGAVVERRTLFR